jgi:hypothetical protein
VFDTGWLWDIAGGNRKGTAAFAAVPQYTVNVLIGKRRMMRVPFSTIALQLGK